MAKRRAADGSADSSEVSTISGEEGGGTESIGEHADTKGISSLDVAWLMLSDIVGTSVLTFAGVARQLGWLPTVLFIAGLFPASLFVSVCMAKARTLVLEIAMLRRTRAPRVETMGEMAKATIRSPRATSLVYLAVYGYTLLGQASYLLVLGESLQDVLLSDTFCIYTAVVIGCAFLALPVIRTRQLAESVTLCFVNTLLIVTVVVVALASIAMEGRPPCAKSPAVNPELSFFSAMGAATNVVYSYAGQWMYFEMMDTMEEPRDFPRAFCISGPVMVATYLTVALVGYYYGVEEGNIIEGMPRGNTMRVVAVLLFLHVMVVYLIKSVVLQRYFHRRFSPGDVEARTPASFAKHGGLGVLMLGFGFVVANAVPFFSELLGLIGGFCGGPVNFIFPIFIYLVALGRRDDLLVHDGANTLESPVVTAEDNLSLRPTSYGTMAFGNSENDGGPRSSEMGEVQGSNSGFSSSIGDESDEDFQWEESSVKAACRGLRALPAFDLAVIAAICVFILLTMVFGVTDVVSQIIKKSGEFGAPFTCHALRFEGTNVTNASSCSI